MSMKATVPLHLEHTIKEREYASLQDYTETNDRGEVRYRKCPHELASYMTAGLPQRPVVRGKRSLVG